MSTEKLRVHVLETFDVVGRKVYACGRTEAAQSTNHHVDRATFLKVPGERDKVDCRICLKEYCIVGTTAVRPDVLRGATPFQQVAIFWAVRHPNGTYYRAKTAIGPCFGAESGAAFRFKTKHDAECEIASSWKFGEAFPVMVTLNQATDEKVGAR